RSRCAIAIVEVGLGGRYDATNAAEPAVSVIASIGLDHQRILGSSLDAIAREKAGVLRAGRPAFLAEQRPTAERALRSACRTLSAACRTAAPVETSARLGLAGEHQRQNAGLARAAAEALRTAETDIADSAIRTGLRRAH